MKIIAGHIPAAHSRRDSCCRQQEPSEVEDSVDLRGFADDEKLARLAHDSLGLALATPQSLPATLAKVSLLMAKGCEGDLEARQKVSDFFEERLEGGASQQELPHLREVAHGAFYGTP